MWCVQVAHMAARRIRVGRLRPEMPASQAEHGHQVLALKVRQRRSTPLLLVLSMQLAHTEVYGWLIGGTQPYICVSEGGSVMHVPSKHRYNSLVAAGCDTTCDNLSFVL
jgi:hypothetical protein